MGLSLPGLDFLNQFTSDGKKFFGSRPKIEPYPTSEKILADLQKANESALPGAKKIAADLNQFNFANFLNTLGTLGFTNLYQTNLRNAQAFAEGRVPEDVSRRITESNAGRAVEGGYSYPGSTIRQNREARDFGLTSLDLMQRGPAMATSFLGAFPFLPGLQGAQGFLMSPGQQMDVTQSQFEADKLIADIAAAPDPVKRGRADQEMALLGMILSVYGGGPGYQGFQRTQPNVTGQQQPYGGGGGGGGGGFLGGIFGGGGNRQNYSFTPQGGGNFNDWGNVQF